MKKLSPAEKAWATRRANQQKAAQKRGGGQRRGHRGTGKGGKKKHQVPAVGFKRIKKGPRKGEVFPILSPGQKAWRTRRAREGKKPTTKPIQKPAYSFKDFEQQFNSYPWSMESLKLLSHVKPRNLFREYKKSGRTFEAWAKPLNIKLMEEGLGIETAIRLGILPSGIPKRVIPKKRKTIKQIVRMNKDLALNITLRNPSKRDLVFLAKAKQLINKDKTTWAGRKVYLRYLSDREVSESGKYRYAAAQITVERDSAGRPEFFIGINKGYYWNYTNRKGYLLYTLVHELAHIDYEIKHSQLFNAIMPEREAERIELENERYARKVTREFRKKMIIR